MHMSTDANYSLTELLAWLFTFVIWEMPQAITASPHGTRSLRRWKIISIFLFTEKQMNLRKSGGCDEMSSMKTEREWRVVAGIVLEDRKGEKREGACHEPLVQLILNDSHCAVFYQRQGLPLSPSHIFSHDPRSSAQGVLSFLLTYTDLSTHRMVAGERRDESEVCWGVVMGQTVEMWTCPMAE